MTTENKKHTWSKKIYIIIVSLITLLLGIDYIPAIHPYVNWLTPPIVLFAGLIFAFIFGTPYHKFNSKASKKLLQWSVVGLGFGMNLQAALASGAQGMSYTLVSVITTLALGIGLGCWLLGMDKKMSFLIGAGTAICGGSAIAAVAPVIKAKDKEISVALGTIFVLNAIALFLFPYLGHLLGMTQQTFGTWAAISIHDTSSVVGAGAAYGEEALKTATMVKLTRALWIIPVAFASSFLFRNKGHKVSIPWFIFFFVLAILFNTYVLTPYFPVGGYINVFARKAMVLTMFFIGASLSRDSLRGIGMRPFVLGILLWLIVSISSLAVVEW